MDLGVTFTKYVVFFFNFLFAIFGIAMVAMGFGVRTKFEPYEAFAENFAPYTILLICVGAVVFLIAFFGCCGAIKENTCMLFFYSIILILIILVEAGLVYAALTKKAAFESAVDKRLYDTIKNYKENAAYRQAWNLLETELTCCGVESKSDWQGVFPAGQLPGSCCGIKDVNSVCSFEQGTNKGCKDAFIEYVKNNIDKVAILAIVVALIQVLAVIFSCCLYSVYRRSPRNYSY